MSSPAVLDQVTIEVSNSLTQMSPGHQVCAPSYSTALFPPSLPSCSRPPIRLDSCPESLLNIENDAHFWIGEKLAKGLSPPQVITIDLLPDDVLLPIFDLCEDEDQDTKKGVEAWQSLVHVCRRWRSIVFGSPRRLDLHLFCTPNTPARNTLDVWPALPILIEGSVSSESTSSMDNIIAALERNDRVTYIKLDDFTESQLKELSAAMQEPFPELLNLRLWSTYKPAPVIPVPDSFLGGSAPGLRFLQLGRIPFPGLPKLLSSAGHLSELGIYDIPHSGYFSPEALVTALSTLTSLKMFFLEFNSPRSCPDPERRRSPPLTRSVLPSLFLFQFRGVSEYLEDLVTRINTPRLDFVRITFFNQIIFEIPRLVHFISRNPSLKAPDSARVVSHGSLLSLRFPSQTSDSGMFDVNTLCDDSDWQLSFLEQICTSFLPLLSTVENLYIYDDNYSLLGWKEAIENTLWLDLLRPFTAVKNLYLCKIFAPRIAPALEELVGSRRMEVLPTLQNIFLEELERSAPVQEGIGQFSATRQSSGHPIVVSPWDRDQEE